MSTLPAQLLHLATRRYPIERGKFKILNSIYFRYVAPKESAVLVSTLSYGIRMSLDISEFLQAHLYLYGSYELPSVRFIRRVLTPGDVVADVGAQIGYITLAMATLAKGRVTVHAFEPEPNNIQRLRNNIALNPGVDVRVVEKAVSDTNGSIRLYLSKDHNAGTHSTISGGSNVSEAFVEIPAVTLDHYVSEQGISALRLIKIDVEGGEYEVNKGAQETLQTLRPIVLMELSDALQESRGFSTVEFKTLMKSYGYSAYTIADDGTLIPSSVEQRHAMDNVVFLHDSETVR
jgi:FkbM family methyltransferase